MEELFLCSRAVVSCMSVKNTLMFRLNESEARSTEKQSDCALFGFEKCMVPYLAQISVSACKIYNAKLHELAKCPKVQRCPMLVYNGLRICNPHTDQTSLSHNPLLRQKWYINQ